MLFRLILLALAAAGIYCWMYGGAANLAYRANRGELDRAVHDGASDFSEFDSGPSF
jgi:hypothetical protein